MRRLLISLMLVGVAASVALVAWGGQGQDFSKVQIQATKVSGNIYVLEGAGAQLVMRLCAQTVVMT